MGISLSNFSLGEGIGINTDILDTNIINLTVVIGVLVYVGGDVLSSLLTNRKEMILKTLQDADDRYKEAEQKIADAKEQLELAKVKAEEIRAQSKASAALGTTNLLNRVEEDIKRLEETKQTTIRLEEEKAVAQVCQQVSRLALDQAVEKLKTSLDSNVQRRIIDLNIALLGNLAKN
jgi:F-type H+-transporting ATPase subunit b|uniref:ATP synthase subunit b, chloroplastic n=1 Tax=Cymbomonas tetramitiformis TaxID=36881 RepID=A0A166QIZ0_9CHLO|nr:CF0 subunit I of ATP synthase [Cymbomonas tetramitiformis]ANA56919.1 CF0 subunit I of ATP synthase [Cymbomonas tetramitiformis]